MMDEFLARHDHHSDVFIKHVQALGRVWGMPCDTEEERKMIFEELVSMKTWKQKGSQPKAANWFAWNLAADNNM